MAIFFCEFGHAHDVLETCVCQNKYGIPAHEFKSAMNSTFGKWSYVPPSKITERMRTDVLVLIKWQSDAANSRYPT